MSIPDGSRHRTSPRSDSAIRSVGRSRMDGRVGRHLEQRAQVAELDAAVDQHRALVELGEGDREVERDGRLAHAALGREDAHDPGRAGRLARLEVLAHLGDPGHQVEAGERHRQDAVDPGRGVGLDRVLGHGQDDHRDAELGFVDLLDQLGSLDPALEEGVDQDDVGADLVDRRDRPTTLGQDVEQLDPRLRVEQPADVLGDLRDVLDDQQARLVTRWHRLDDTTRVVCGTDPEGPARQPDVGTISP